MLGGLVILAAVTAVFGQDPPWGNKDSESITWKTNGKNHRKGDARTFWPTAVADCTAHCAADDKCDPDGSWIQEPADPPGRKWNSWQNAGKWCPPPAYLGKYVAKRKGTNYNKPEGEDKSKLSKGKFGHGVKGAILPCQAVVSKAVIDMYEDDLNTWKGLGHAMTYGIMKGRVHTFGANKGDKRDQFNGYYGSDNHHRLVAAIKVGIPLLVRARFVSPFGMATTCNIKTKDWSTCKLIEGDKDQLVCGYPIEFNARMSMGVSTKKEACAKQKAEQEKASFVEQEATLLRGNNNDNNKV